MKRLKMKASPLLYANIPLSLFIASLAKPILISSSDSVLLEQIQYSDSFGFLSSALALSTAFTSVLIAGLGILWIGAVFTSWIHQYKLENRHILTNSLDLEKAGIDVLGNIPYDSQSIKSGQNEMKGDAFSRAKAIHTGLLCNLHDSSVMPATYQAIIHAIEKKSHLNVDNTILVTSPESNAGTTTTAVNLAIQLAKAGNKTLIVDGNISRPILDLLLLGTQRNVGLADIFRHHKNWHELVRETSTQDLFIIPAGRVSDSNEKGIPVKELMQFILEVKSVFDMVIFDTAPIPESPETAEYASVMDSVILVAKSRKSSVEDVVEAAENIRKYNPDVLGVLITGIREEDFYDFTQYYNVNIEWPVDKGHNETIKPFPSQTCQCLLMYNPIFQEHQRTSSFMEQ